LRRIGAFFCGLALVAVLAELGFSFVPLHEFFRELDRRQRPIRSDDAWHPNDEGYRLLAERISTFLDGKLPIRAPRFAEVEDAGQRFPEASNRLR
jgi:hypothetical protein